MSFGPDVGGLIGDLSWFALKGVTNVPSPDYASTIPQTVFMIYQCIFVIITPALITGAIAIGLIAGLVFYLAGQDHCRCPRCEAGHRLGSK